MNGSVVIGIVCLTLTLALTFLWTSGCRRAPQTLTPSELSYPVLLVDDGKIAEVCLNAEELTLRPENTDHVITERFWIVDSQGRRLRIENFRSVEKRPSTLSRVFNATVYSVQRFRVAFDLRPERTLNKEEVLAQLNDRTWLEPLTNAHSVSFPEAFVAYRADRFREFGNSRDRMPDAASPSNGQ